MTENAEPQNPRLSEGLLLATLSTGAYLLTFTYELGFTSHFKIPTQFITVSLTNIFIWAGAMLLVLVALFFVTNFTAMLLPDNIPRPIMRAVAAVLPIVLIYLVTILLFGFEDWLFLLILTVTLGIFIFIYFLYPLITQRGKGSYVDKLEAQDQHESTMKDLMDRGLRAYIANTFGRYVWFFVLGLIISLYASWTAGKALAFRQTEFYVTSTSPEMVILRIYGDSMICAPFDRTTREVQANFSVIKVGADPSLRLNLETLGPLHLPTPSSPSSAATSAAPSSPVATVSPTP